MSKVRDDDEVVHVLVVWRNVAFTLRRLFWHAIAVVKMDLERWFHQDV